MEKNKPLSLKSDLDRKAFVKEYLTNNMDSRKAMKKLNPSIAEGTLRNKVWRWSKDPRILKDLALVIEELGLSKKELGNIGIANILHVITKCDNKDSDSLVASNLLLKVAGLYVENSNQTLTVIGSDVLEQMVRKSGVLGTKKVKNEPSKGTS